ncbi:hypothetical protein GCM10011608_01440 [Micromonospora sonchi]|uniref:Uncharacterized protein n=1 Tax=Micromonospora sonchi TaxID=1763543 RepID=A0A917WQ48_9ACTN|nr:hypothetical protein [Micromonospora sonchi]GGM20579.1 hypothetical protein GCM10011608_01440 [Micromonospora sonchi]
MSNQPGGSTAAAQPDRPQPVDPAGGTKSVAAPAGRPAPAPGTLVLALLAVGWLAAMLWSTRQAISSATAGVTAVSLSAFALPGVISAALVAGAAFGLAAGELVARCRDGVTLRFVAAVAAGLLVGLAAALAIDLTYAGDTTTRTIAGTTAAAAIIGGALAGARNGAVVGAVAGSALGTLLFVVAFSVARDPLFNLFGAGESQQSLVTAATWVSRTESLIAGLIAGVLAFGYLSWARRRAVRGGGAGARWPGYLVAGAGPGLLLLLAEVIIRVGGRSLIDLAAALSEADAVAQTSLGTSRVDNAIWVLFVGALTALITFGRTLTPAPDDEAR